MNGLQVVFGDLPDPRDSNARHDLTDILTIALAATLCGADTCVAFAAFGRAKLSLLRPFLTLPHGIPAHDTFSRVLRHLDPTALEQALARFVRALGQSTAGEVVAVDGKSLRRAYERGRAHMPPLSVSACLVQTRLVLATTQAMGNNEVEGVLDLLKLVSLEGAVVTGDALHCTRQTAAAIRERGADYVLALKGSRASLAHDADALLSQDGLPFAEVEERGHGRHEHRVAWVAAAPGLGERHAMRDLAALGRIEAWRRVGEGPETHKVRTFVLSREMGPRELLDTARAHWTIENGLHWPLDVVFREDWSRTRKDHGPRNLAVLRRLALKMLRAHPDKASLSIKRQRAGWEDAFLAEIMTQMQ